MILREEKLKEEKKKQEVVEVRKKEEEELLREVTVKIGLERINTQKEIIVEALLDSRVTGLVISSEFTIKKGFKLNKIKKPIYVSLYEKYGQFFQQGKTY